MGANTFIPIIQETEDSQVYDGNSKTARVAKTFLKNN